MHTKSSKIRKHMVYDVDKDSEYCVMKIIWFKNILWVSPMGMIPGAVSNYYRSDPTTVVIS